MNLRTKSLSDIWNIHRRIISKKQKQKHKYLWKCVYNLPTASRDKGQTRRVVKKLSLVNKKKKQTISRCEPVLLNDSVESIRKTLMNQLTVAIEVGLCLGVENVLNVRNIKKD